MEKTEIGEAPTPINFCRGTNEAKRRLKQLANGTAGFTVHVPRIKSWKSLDAKAKRARKKVTPVAAAQHDMTVQTFDTPAIQPSPTGRATRSKGVLVVGEAVPAPKVLVGAAQGAIVGTVDAVTKDNEPVEVKTAAAVTKKRVGRIASIAATLMGVAGVTSIDIPPKRAPQTPPESRKRKSSMGGGGK